jgi:hypothetical protein
MTKEELHWLFDTPAAFYTEFARWRRLKEELEILVEATKDIDINHLKQFGVKYCRCSSVVKG